MLLHVDNAISIKNTNEIKSSTSRLRLLLNSSPLHNNAINTNTVINTYNGIA